MVEENRESRVEGEGEGEGRTGGRERVRERRDRKRKVPRGEYSSLNLVTLGTTESIPVYD